MVTLQAVKLLIRHTLKIIISLNKKKYNILNKLSTLPMKNNPLLSSSTTSCNRTITNPNSHLYTTEY